MGSRTYKTTSWLRKNAHSKSSGSSCTVITKSKKGKMIYRVQRALKPESLQEKEPGEGRLLKCTNSSVSHKLANASQKQSLPNSCDASGKNVNLQGDRKARPHVADEPQKHVVDEPSLPQFIDTPVPNVRTVHKGRVKVMKSRSVEVRKIRRESNNLLNSVCCKGDKKRKNKIDLTENKSLPDLLNSNLYNFCCADGSVKNRSPSVPGTFVELRPKKIRFSSKEMVYPDVGKLGHEQFRKRSADKQVKRIQKDQSSETKRDNFVTLNSTNKPMKTNETKVKEEPLNDLKADDVLDTPLEEVGDVRVYVEDAKSRAPGLGKILKEMVKNEIPIGNVLGRSSELEFAVDGNIGPVKGEIKSKNGTCLFKADNLDCNIPKPSDQPAKSVKVKENVGTGKEPEILSFRRNENLTIHKHSVKRPKKVNTVAYETQVIEKDGKTITKLKPKNGRRNSQSTVHAKSPSENQKVSGKPKANIAPRKDADDNSTQTAMKSPEINSTVNTSSNLPRTKNVTDLRKMIGSNTNDTNAAIVGQDVKQAERTHPLKLPGPTFDEVVNSMRLESENFLKKSNAYKKETVDYSQPIKWKKEAPMTKTGTINGVGIPSDQINVEKEGFLSKLKAHVNDQFVIGKTLNQLRATEKVGLPLAEGSLRHVGGGQAVTSKPIENNMKKTESQNEPVDVSSQTQRHNIFSDSSSGSMGNKNNAKFSVNSNTDGHGRIELKPDPNATQKLVYVNHSGKNVANDGPGRMVQKSVVASNMESAQLHSGNRTLVQRPQQPSVDPLSSPTVQKPSFSSKINFNVINQDPLSSVTNSLKHLDQIKLKPTQPAMENAAPERRRVTKKIYNCRAEYKNDVFLNPDLTIPTNVLHPSNKHLKSVTRNKMMRGNEGGSSLTHNGEVTPNVYPENSQTGGGSSGTLYSMFSALLGQRGSGSYSVGPSKFGQPPLNAAAMEAKKGANGDGGHLCLSSKSSSIGACEGGNLSCIPACKPVFPPVVSNSGAAAGGFGEKASCVPTCKPAFPPVVSNSGAAAGGFGENVSCVLTCKPAFPPAVSNSGAATGGFGENASCVPTCKPAFPPAVSNSGAAAGGFGENVSCVPTCKPAFPLHSSSNTAGFSASEGNAGSKPVFPPPCCSPPPCEEPKYEMPSINFGPPPDCPCAPSMKSTTYSILDVSNMSKPPVPICIDCIPKEKPSFPPKPPGEQNPSASQSLHSTLPSGQMKCPCAPPATSQPVQDTAMHSKYSSIGWFDATKTYLVHKAFSMKCLLAEIIASFLALLKARTYFFRLRKANVCSTCNAVQSSMIASNQPLVAAASSISQSLRPPTEKGKSRQPRFKKKILFIKTVKRPVHDGQSRQAILLEEQRRKAVGSKANPALAYSEVLNIVFNQKNEFAPVAKKQKRRSVMN